MRVREDPCKDTAGSNGILPNRATRDADRMDIRKYLKDDGGYLRTDDGGYLWTDSRTWVGAETLACLKMLF